MCQSGKTVTGNRYTQNNKHATLTLTNFCLVQIWSSYFIKLDLTLHFSSFFFFCHRHVLLAYGHMMTVHDINIHWWTQLNMYWIDATLQNSASCGPCTSSNFNTFDINIMSVCLKSTYKHQWHHLRKGCMKFNPHD